MYRKYYSINDMPQPLTSSCKKESISEKSQNTDLNKLFGKFEIDDIVLGIVIIMLLANDCNDKILLLALAFVFIGGFDGLGL